MSIPILLFVSLASSSTLDYEISQVHISLASSDMSMIVQWAVDVYPLPLYVKYYKDDKTKTALSPSTCRSFHTEPNNPRSREIFTCFSLLSGLEPSNEYDYAIGSESLGWTKDYTLKSKRNGIDARFVIYADFGIGDQTADTITSIRRITRRDLADGIIHIGDIAYDLDSIQGTIGDRFLEDIEPVASEIPYMVAHGNHERGNAEIHYKNRFSMPGSSKNLWYSFNYGKAHFIAYTQEPLFGKKTKRKHELMEMQMKFIKNDLDNLDREAYPWLIVYTHRPFYCSNSSRHPRETFDEQDVQSQVHHQNAPADCHQSAKKIRKHFERFWYKNHADLIITGHVHNYERFHPTYKSKSKGCRIATDNYCENAKAPIYLVVGAPGNQESYAPGTKDRHSTSVFQTSRLSFGLLEVFDETHLRWKQMASDSNEVIDFLDLYK